MVLNLLVFVRIGFVGKLTKLMDGYNKQDYIGAISTVYGDQWISSARVVGTWIMSIYTQNGIIWPIENRSQDYERTTTIL